MTTSNLTTASGRLHDANDAPQDAVVIPEEFRAQVQHSARWRLLNAADKLNKVSPRDVAEFDAAAEVVREALALLDTTCANQPIAREEACRLACEASEDLFDKTRDKLAMEEIDVRESAKQMMHAVALRDFAEQHAGDEAEAIA